MTDPPPRRFTRLAPGAPPVGSGRFPVPEDGMCLSTFLILHPPQRPREVLLGRLDPAAPWDSVGGLDPSRIQRWGGLWLLPACQWLFFEEPRASAERIAREMLESPLPPVEGPTVYSDTTQRRTEPGADPHWDIHFLYEGTWPSPEPPRARMWKELRFLDPARVPRSELGRNHGDIVDLVGLSPGP